MKKTCPTCGIEFEKTGKGNRRMYCRPQCRPSLKTRAEVQAKNIPRSSTGAIGELAVCVYLLQQGFQVFRNVSDRGYCDAIAVDPNGLVMHLEIRTAYFVNGRIQFPSKISHFGNVKPTHYGLYFPQDGEVVVTECMHDVNDRFFVKHSEQE